MNISGEYLPTVAILIAARNEEKRIDACLAALAKLDYPADKLEILIGNDHSEDMTAAIVEKYTLRYNNWRLIDITDNDTGLLGKANALAQMARYTTADILFMTDADVRVNRQWITGMLEGFSSDTILVSGSTAVERLTFFSRLQNADWLYHLGTRHWLSSWGRPTAATGTNMAITRKAYQAVGGFEKVTHSITEDYDLSCAVIRRQMGTKTLLNPNVYAVTDPAPDFSSLLLQQRRWLSSTPRMPIPAIAMMFLQYMFMPMVIVAAWWLAMPALLALFAIKCCVDIALLLYTFRRLRIKPDPAIYLYSAYAGLCYPVFLLSWMFKDRDDWKGRRYPRTSLP